LPLLPGEKFQTQTVSKLSTDWHPRGAFEAFTLASLSRISSLRLTYRYGN